MVLTAQPASDVVLTVTSGDTGEATVGPATLTFTTANWNSPQTVTVTGVNDLLADGNQVTTLTVAVDDATSSNEFDPVADQTVSATTVDNDTAGFTIVGVGRQHVGERVGHHGHVHGGPDGAAGERRGADGDERRHGRSDGQPGDADLHDGELEQSADGDGDGRQRCCSPTGTRSTTLTVTVDDATSSNEFDPVADQTVSATTVDNDTAGFTIVESRAAARR